MSEPVNPAENVAMIRELLDRDAEARALDVGAEALLAEVGERAAHAAVEHDVLGPWFCWAMTSLRLSWRLSH